MRVLGIDPGSITTGYGVVEKAGARLVHICDGSIHGSSTCALPERLLAIARGLEDIIREYRPEAVSVESIFFAKNVRSAIMLGHARGAVLLAAASAGLPVFEYAPRAVKLAVTGYGNAEKEQVQKMVKMLLMTPATAQADAADALAIAICHINHLRPGLMPKAAQPKKPSLVKA